MKVFKENFKLLLVGTGFQIKVWLFLLSIKKGDVISYKTVAEKIGHPKSVRAVANTIASNRLAYFIPCHRVIRKSGSDIVGEYRYGKCLKKRLLDKGGVFL